MTLNEIPAGLSTMIASAIGALCAVWLRERRQARADRRSAALRRADVCEDSARE